MVRGVFLRVPVLGKVPVRAVLVCCLLAGLAACGPLPFLRPAPFIVPAAVVEQRVVQGCGTERLQHLAGQPFPLLAGYHLPGQLRVLRPGQGVTREVMPSRLNAQVDEAGVILRLFCG